MEIEKLKILILAGGYGTRLSEETHVLPKPMVEIGGKPILWHIMKIYSHFGFNEFIILLGYKGHVIKEYFANYFLHQSSVTIDLATNQTEVHQNVSEPWKVTLLDTGIDTMTGGRILQAEPFIDKGPFMLTYGDTLMDIDINALLAVHASQGKKMTMTIAQPEGRYGVVDSNKDGLIEKFEEKPMGDGSWINAGFFVCEKSVLDYIEEGNRTVFEQKPLEKLANSRELAAYRHRGFYKCMDTLRDKVLLNKLVRENRAAWKTW